jgi:hypothetical protein
MLVWLSALQSIGCGVRFVYQHQEVFKRMTALGNKRSFDQSNICFILPILYLTRLSFQLTIEDPATLLAPATAEWELQALDEPFSIYECNAF